MKSKGFTLIELLIACAIGGIGLVMLFGIVFGIVSGIVSGNTILSSKQQCINAQGKWTEGIQYGKLTQLCTYN